MLAGLAAYWYWSPYWVVHQMQAAARAGDAERFNDHVDYPQLRDSLKGQLSARIAGALMDRSNAGNPLAQAGSALGGMLGLALVERLVDAVVRPDTVMRAMRQGSFQLHETDRRDRGDGDGDGGDAGGADAAPRTARWQLERKGSDQVLIRLEPDDAAARGAGTALVLRRDGFANWKLTAIRLPD